MGERKGEEERKSAQKVFFFFPLFKISKERQKHRKKPARNIFNTFKDKKKKRNVNIQLFLKKKKNHAVK